MGHHSCCSKQKVKRGLWSPEEDEKLINYITTYGHGCWSSVPRQAGLQRCGKSCRLRWINYLRPDLKRGNFSHQEESLIVELHRTLGNRWAQIARHLPGRTDNEVKNFWNSSIKKKLVGDGTGLARNDHKLKPIVDSPTETSSIHMRSSISPLVSYQDQILAPVVHVSPSVDHDLLSQELSREKDATHNAEWVVAPSEWSFEYPNHMPEIYDIHDGGFPSYCFQNNNSEATGASFDQSSSSTLMPKLRDIMDMAEYSTSQNKGIEDVANASDFTSASYQHVGGSNEALDGMLYVDSIMTSSQSLLDHLHVSTSFPSNWEVKY